MMAIQQIYGALLPAKNLPEPLHTVQGDLVGQIILNPHFEIYPPSVTYQRSFWKYVTRTIEAAGEEVDYRIYQRYISLLKASTAIPDQYLSSPPTASYITYFWPPLASHGDQPILGPRKTTLLESRTTIEAGTTGLRTWRASLMLAEWLTIHPDIVGHRRVLELGSGVGFLGIIIASLQRLPNQHSGMLLGGIDAGPARIPNQPAVCLTDVNEDVLERCRYNIGLPTNNVTDHPGLEMCKLNWLDAISDEPSMRALHSQLERIDANVVIGADVVYDLSLIPALVETIRLALVLPSRSKPCSGPDPETPLPISMTRVAWLALSVRREDTIAAFLEKATHRGLEIKDIDWGLPATRAFPGGWEGEDGRSAQDVRLFQLRAASAS